VQLGKIVDYHWKFNTEEQAKKISSEGFQYIILDPQDKLLVRENIMQSLYMCQNPKIIKQYVRCITTIARFDFPGQWPNFVPQIIQFLSQPDEKAVMAGLLGLRGLVKKYEYEMDEERLPLYEIIKVTFGILGGLVNQVIAVDNEKAYQVVYLISKIFYLSNQLYICPYLAENQGANLEPWILFFKTIMDRALPTELDSPNEDMDEIERRDKHICWKTKGVAGQTTYRLFSKYGNPKFADDRYEEFSKAFREKFAVPLLESHLSVLLRR
jgi:importin-7